MRWAESNWMTSQDERSHLLDQLSRAARLSELGVMVAAVFHELNQPLLGIKGFVELMIENLKKGETGKVAEWAVDDRAASAIMAKPAPKPKAKRKTKNAGAAPENK